MLQMVMISKEEKRSCLAVDRASLSCSDEGMLASVVDQAKLIESLADIKEVPHSQIEVAISQKNSTLDLLLLPPEAEIELLSIVTNSRRREKCSFVSYFLDKGVRFRFSADKCIALSKCF